MYAIIFWFNSALAQELSSNEAITKAENTFSELSNISRALQEKLKMSKDPEQLQCIDARSVSVKTLLDFSQQSRDALRNPNLSPALRKSELKKIEFALRSANKYRDEVEACLATTVSQTSGQGSLLLVDESKISTLLATDEADFGLGTTENVIQDIETSTSSSGGSQGLDSESTAPPPASSPYQ